MHINLPTELQGYIQSKITAGVFQSEEEAIGAAVKQMQSEDDKLIALHIAVQKGIDSFDREGGVPYTRELMREIRREAQQDLYSGKPIDPDVLP